MSTQPHSEQAKMDQFLVMCQAYPEYMTAYEPERRRMRAEFKAEQKAQVDWSKLRAELRAKLLAAKQEAAAAAESKRLAEEFAARKAAERSERERKSAEIRDRLLAKMAEEHKAKQEAAAAKQSQLLAEELAAKNSAATVEAQRSEAVAELNERDAAAEAALEAAPAVGEKRRHLFLVVRDEDASATQGILFDLSKFDNVARLELAARGLSRAGPLDFNQFEDEDAESGDERPAKRQKVRKASQALSGKKRREAEKKEEAEFAKLLTSTRLQDAPVMQAGQWVRDRVDPLDFADLVFADLVFDEDQEARLLESGAIKRLAHVDFVELPPNTLMRLCSD